MSLANNADAAYFRLLQRVLNEGRTKVNRTGVLTTGIFGAQERFNLQEGFPLLTTKKVFMKGIVYELLWFLSGSTNIKYLVDNDVHIWDEWAYAKFRKEYLSTISSQADFIKQIRENAEFAAQFGDLGQGTYGWGWRSFGQQPFDIKNGHCDDETHDWLGEGVDQIQQLVDKLQNSPDDRRMVVSAWHPYWVDHCALPPCHCLFQLHTEELTLAERHQEFLKNIWRYPHPDVDDPYESVRYDDHDEMDSFCVPRRRLNCQLYQRSCDLFLGVPFNIASYSLLTILLAHCYGYIPGEFIWTGGDVHIYQNHRPQVMEQLCRDPRPLPTVSINPNLSDIFKAKYEDVKLENYNPHPAIKAEVAV